MYHYILDLLIIVKNVESWKIYISLCHYTSLYLSLEWLFWLGSSLNVFYFVVAFKQVQTVYTNHLFFLVVTPTTFAQCVSSIIEFLIKQLRLLCLASTNAEGLSGRALRKLPFQAHAFFANGRTTMSSSEYAMCLVKAVAKEQQARDDLSLTSSSSKK